MKMTLALVASCVLLLGVSSCSTSQHGTSPEQQSFTPAVDSTMFLGKLRASGELPGIPKNTPSYGQLFYGSFFVKDPPAPSYPKDCFYFVASPESNDEYLMYTVSKESEDSDWELIRAWVTDRKGREVRVLKEAK